MSEDIANVLDRIRSGTSDARDAAILEAHIMRLEIVDAADLGLGTQSDLPALLMRQVI